MQDRLEDIDEDPQAYLQNHQQLLPPWLVNEAMDDSPINNRNDRPLATFKRRKTGFATMNDMPCEPTPVGAPSYGATS